MSKPAYKVFIDMTCDTPGCPRIAQYRVLTGNVHIDAGKFCELHANHTIDRLNETAKYIESLSTGGERSDG